MNIRTRLISRMVLAAVMVPACAVAGEYTMDWYTFDGLAGDLINLWWYDASNYEGAMDDVVPVIIAPDQTTIWPQNFGGEAQQNRTILTQEVENRLLHG